MKLVVADLSNIEGRLVAWLAGEEWKLAAFRAYDRGAGADLYNITATSIIGGDPFKVAKKDRNIYGKVPDLACFGPDTRVLTHTGYKRIVEVLTTDMLWDGTEWVTHHGIIDRGVRRIVNVDGTEVTPDHLIDIQGTWQPALRLATCASILSRALATASERLPSSASFGVRVEASARSSPDAIAGRSLPPSKVIYVKVRVPHALSARIRNLGTTVSDILATRIFYRMKPTAAGSSTVSQRASAGAVIRMIKAMQITGAGAYRFIQIGLKTAVSFWRTYSPWTVGISLHWNLTASMSTGDMYRGTCVLYPVRSTGKTSVPSAHCKHVSLNWRNVYDIVDAGPRNRFTILTDSGHLIVHNCGYGGGVGAVQTFAKAYGVRMSDHWGTIQANIDAAFVTQAYKNLEKWGRQQLAELEISETEWLASESVKLAWRARHPATRQLWYACEEAARNAIRSPNTTFEAGPHLKFRCMNHVSGQWLLVRLPSGKYLTYMSPALTEDGSISYMGYGEDAEGGSARIWSRQYTYGGHMVENACQALAGDVLKYNLPAVEAAGYEVVLTVHDEDVTQTPDTEEFNAKALSALISTVPDWAPGLPLAAAGFESYRYKKED